MNVPSSSENSRRHSSEGSSKSRVPGYSSASSAARALWAGSVWSSEAIVWNGRFARARSANIDQIV